MKVLHITTILVWIWIAYCCDTDCAEKKVILEESDGLQQRFDRGVEEDRKGNRKRHNLARYLLEKIDDTERRHTLDENREVTEASAALNNQSSGVMLDEDERQSKRSWPKWPSFLLRKMGDADHQDMETKDSKEGDPDISQQHKGGLTVWRGRRTSKMET